MSPSHGQRRHAAAERDRWLQPTAASSVLIGPNGAGKSTLLRVLSGELRRRSGAGAAGRARPPHLSVGRTRARRAVVPQASVLSFPFTVLEVAMLGITRAGLCPALVCCDGRSALEALEAVGMAAWPDRLYVHLSGGERQRVHVARALCQLSATDAASRREPLPAARRADRQPRSRTPDPRARGRTAPGRAGRAVLAVMHDLNLAAALADELVLLVRGQVAATGPGEQVLQTSCSPPPTAAGSRPTARRRTASPSSCRRPLSSRNAQDDFRHMNTRGQASEMRLGYFSHLRSAMELC